MKGIGRLSVSVVEMPEHLAEVSLLKIVLESKDLTARRGAEGLPRC